MIALTHLIALLAFILLGGLGMAALQDGGSIIAKRLASMFGSHLRQKPVSIKPQFSPLTFQR